MIPSVVMAATNRSGPVDVTTMTDPNDEHDEVAIVHLVDDPVVTDPHPIRTLLALQRNTPRWTRLVRE